MIGRWRDILLPPGRRLRWVLPALMLLILAILQWQIPGWLDRAELWAVDARFQLRGKETPHFPIVVVALDETSFQMMGDLQGENIRAWPRHRWAELIVQIAAGEPRVIGLDIVLDTPGWDAGGDQALAQALEEAGNVVLPSHLERTASPGYQHVTFSPPLAPLAQAAAAVGVANLPTDVDGAIRRTAMLYQWEDQIHPAFPLALATLFAGEAVQVDRAELGSDFTLPIHFRGPEDTFTTLPMIDVWEGQVPAATFHDAIVLIGYTTQLEQDRHLTPFGDMAGVHIQAHAVDTLLAGDWLHRTANWITLLSVAAAAVAATVLMNLRHPGVGVLVLASGLVIYLVLGVILFAHSDLLLPLAAPTAATVATGGIALVERLAFAEREKRYMRQRFSGVMSPERVRAVMERWEELRQPDRPQKEAAVLFSDIRSFTRSTEFLVRNNRVPEMVNFLGLYLDAMAEAVFAEGGVIYDVEGDGLMILFGLPEPYPDYALRAARAAVRMALATEPLQEIWPLRDQYPLRMGIGIHCGPIIDAIVGHGRRVEYSVIGDPVNTAARIESHSKVVMQRPRPPGGQVPETATILLSANLYDQIRPHVLVDADIPPFEARGKSEPLQVVRLLGMGDLPDLGPGRKIKRFVR
ncbi:MAG: adenylate/guanylate cyclase domain-containing protein [Anaerolineae bacterium]|nr:adenylate/guanylate cyclase domain-containing protein [Anaerolineae bacterium]